MIYTYINIFLKTYMVVFVLQIYFENKPFIINKLLGTRLSNLENEII